MIRIPSHIEALKSYNPGKPVEAWREELGLNEVAVLWNNENNLGVPQKALEAIQQATQNLNLYPDPICFELRQAIAQNTGRRFEEITVGNGSEELLFNINKAFLHPGDEILTAEGTFVAVFIWAKAANLEVSKAPMKDYGFDLDALYQRITPRTKVIYIANPNNPTGTIIPEEELKRFIAKVPEEIIVIVDEAYIEYAVELNADFPDSTKWDYPNLITLRTFSKAYGLAGMRLGYGIAGEKLSSAMRKIRMTFAPSGPAQAAGIGALKDEAFLKTTVELNAEAVKSFQIALDEKGMKRSDSYGNFVMTDLETSENSDAFVNHLRSQGVFVRQLPAFGMPSCVRISTGRPEENERFLAALEMYEK